MINNFLNLLELSQYVWLSFGITFLVCGFLYYKTYKKLKKYEKEFANKLLELEQTDRSKELKKSKVASQVFAANNNL